MNGFTSVFVMLLALPAARSSPGLRINLFFSQGTPAHYHELAWQPPMKEAFHVPERFGLIRW